MDHHDDHNDRDDVGGDLYSEDGDNGLRSSLNLAGLSMSSSLQSDFQVPRTDDPGSIGDELSQIGGDDEERDGEGLEEDRDNEGRLRRSMILSKLSDDEDGDARTITVLETKKLMTMKNQMATSWEMLSEAIAMIY
ncbi:Aste57867_8677 [Globisporangium polare]